VTQILGWLSFVVLLLSYIPYVIDILKGNTKPERAAFFIWTVLGFSLISSQLAEGGRESVLLSVGGTVGPLIVFLLSIKYGVGGFLLRDKFALVFAAIGLLLWYLTNNPAFVLWIAILIDSAGVYLLLIKSYKDPASELPLLWASGVVAGTLSILSVGRLDINLLAFPVWLTINNGVIFTTIIYRTKKLGINNAT
jgi:hypothetical protein